VHIVLFHPYLLAWVKEFKFKLILNSKDLIKSIKNYFNFIKNIINLKKDIFLTNYLNYMEKSSIVVRARKFKTNKLLSRK